MSRKRHTPEQVVNMLRQVEVGIAKLHRKSGGSPAAADGVCNDSRERWLWD